MGGGSFIKQSKREQKEKQPFHSWTWQFSHHNRNSRSISCLFLDFILTFVVFSAPLWMALLYTHIFHSIPFICHSLDWNQCERIVSSTIPLVSDQCRSISHVNSNDHFCHRKMSQNQFQIHFKFIYFTHFYIEKYEYSDKSFGIKHTHTHTHTSIHWRSTQIGFIAPYCHIIQCNVNVKFRTK